MDKQYDFPVATHSYFHVQNKQSERRRFLSSDSYEPQFLYNNAYTVDELSRRLKLVTPDSSESRSLEFVLAAFNLQASDIYYDEFRNMNRALYGEPNKMYFDSIITRVEQRVDANTMSLWRDVCRIIGDKRESTVVIEPDMDVFQRLKDYFNRYRPVNAMPPSVATALQSYLDLSGLAQKGWKLKLVSDNSHARTHHATKTITVGREYKSRTAYSANRIAVHEIYGHALRGAQKTLAESEGFAILLEQLTDSRFKYRRSYRYLAVSLGWGVAGSRLTFRQVYDALWRIMVIMNSYSEEIAKQHAFDECYRAFRGGRPDMAGAVYLKDSIYLESNLAMWRKLESHLPSYEEFVDIIEGRRVIL